MAKAGHGLSSDKSWHHLCTKLGLGVESDKGWGQTFSRPLMPDQEGAQSAGGGGSPQEEGAARVGKERRLFRGCFPADRPSPRAFP